MTTNKKNSITINDVLNVIHSEALEIIENGAKTDEYECIDLTPEALELLKNSNVFGRALLLGNLMAYNKLVVYYIVLGDNAKSLSPTTKLALKAAASNMLEQLMMVSIDAETQIENNN